MAHPLQPGGAMAVGPVSSASHGPPALPADAASWTVRAGDTLSGIAWQLQRQGVPGTIAELVRALARLNGLSRPDHLEVGQVLTLPAGPRGGSADEDVVSLLERGARSVSGAIRTRFDEPRTRLENTLLRWVHRLPSQPAAAPGASGTPLFRQGDPAWRTERLGVSGEGPTLGQAGCALTACAMALSRVGGTVLTPDALLRHLRASGGFQGPLLDWSAAGSAIPGGTCATAGALDREQLDRELDAGRPVLLRVVHDVQGQSRQHWICLTGRDPAGGLYTANDPATGRTTRLTSAGGTLASLEGEPVQYASDGRMVRFAVRQA